MTDVKGFFQQVSIILTEDYHGEGADIKDKENPHILKGVLVGGEQVEVHMSALNGDAISIDDMNEFVEAKYANALNNTAKKSNTKDVIENQYKDKALLENPELTELLNSDDGSVKKKAKRALRDAIEDLMEEDNIDLEDDSIKDIILEDSKIKKGSEVVVAGALKYDDEKKSYILDSRCIGKSVEGKSPSGFYPTNKSTSVPVVLSTSKIKKKDGSFFEKTEVNVKNEVLLNEKRFDALMSNGLETLKYFKEKNGGKYLITFDLIDKDVPKEIENATKTIMFARSNTFDDLIDAQNSIVKYIKKDFETNIKKFNIKLPVIVPKDYMAQFAIKNLQQGVEVAYKHMIDSHMEQFKKDNPNATKEEISEERGNFIGSEDNSEYGLYSEIKRSAMDILNNPEKKYDVTVTSNYRLSTSGYGFMSNNFEQGDKQGRVQRVVFDPATLNKIQERVALTYGEPGKTVGTSEKAVEEHDKVADKAKDAEVKHNPNTGEVGSK